MRIVNFIGEKGCGKTLFSCNIARELSRRGKVVLIDLDMGKRQIPQVFDVEDEAVYDIYDFFIGNCKIEKALIEVEENLSVIAASFLPEKSSLSEENISRLIEEVDCDYLILDSSGISEDEERIIEGSITDLVSLSPFHEDREGIDCFRIGNQYTKALKHGGEGEKGICLGDFPFRQNLQGKTPTLFEGEEERKIIETMATCLIERKENIRKTETLFEKILKKFKIGNAGEREND